jgi:hypothetical protein
VKRASTDSYISGLAKDLATKEVQLQKATARLAGISSKTIRMENLLKDKDNIIKKTEDEKQKLSER